MILFNTTERIRFVTTTHPFTSGELPVFASGSSRCTDYTGIVSQFRGQAILLASLDDLSEKGLRSASEVILTGCSGIMRKLNGETNSINYHLL